VAAIVIERHRSNLGRVVAVWSAESDSGHENHRHSWIGKLKYGAVGASGAGWHHVRLWRNADLIADMQARRANATYLPDIVLPASVFPPPRWKSARPC
jgi:hypothetical protein